MPGCNVKEITCVHIAHYGLFTLTHITILVFIVVIAAVPVTHISNSFLLSALFLLLF